MFIYFLGLRGLMKINDEEVICVSYRTVSTEHLLTIPPRTSTICLHAIEHLQIGSHVYDGFSWLA